MVDWWKGMSRNEKLAVGLLAVATVIPLSVLTLVGLIFLIGNFRTPVSGSTSTPIGVNLVTMTSASVASLTLTPTVTNTVEPAPSLTAVPTVSNEPVGRVINLSSGEIYKLYAGHGAEYGPLSEGFVYLDQEVKILAKHATWWFIEAGGQRGWVEGRILEISNPGPLPEINLPPPLPSPTISPVPVPTLTSTPTPVPTATSSPTPLIPTRTPIPTPNWVEVPNFYGMAANDAANLAAVMRLIPNLVSISCHTPGVNDGDVGWIRSQNPYAEVSVLKGSTINLEYIDPWNFCPTATSTHTPTPSPTFTVTSTPTVTATPTVTPTITPSVTITATWVITWVPTVVFPVVPPIIVDPSD